MDGWVKLHRKITENWLWEKKPFSDGQAFIDLLLMANYKEKKFRLGNEVVSVDSGTIVTSQVKLSERWGWGRKKVSLFLKALESDGMVVVVSDNKRTNIRIVNYNSYQEFSDTKNEQGTNSNENSTNSIYTDISDDIDKKQEQQGNIKRTSNEHQKGNTGTAREHQRHTNNKDNKDNKGNKENNTPLPPTGEEAADDGFERFWQAYPKKVDKPKAIRAWKKLKPNEETLNEILKAIERQKLSEQWRKDNGQYIPCPATWLNGRRWEDQQEQFVQAAPKSYEFDPNDPYKVWRESSKAYEFDPADPYKDWT